MFSVLPVDNYLALVYRYYHKKPLSLDHPESFSEKLFWLKRYYQNSNIELVQQIYDKYLVRDYIISKTKRNDLLPTLYGVYTDANQIPFDDLPDEYALKLTQGSGCNIFQTRYKKVDPIRAKELLEEWQKSLSDIKKIKKVYNEDAVFFNGKPRIICEELLQDEKGLPPCDIRFFCFNGKPMLYCIDLESVKEDGTKNKEYFRNTYSMNGVFQEVDLGRPRQAELKKLAIDNLDEMAIIAEQLSSDLLFARVDMYNVNGRIICGEITPIPQGGAGVISPESYDITMGEWLQL